MIYYRLKGYHKWQQRTGGKVQWAAVDVHVFGDLRIHGLPATQQLGWIVTILAARLFENRIPSKVNGKPVEKMLRSLLQVSRSMPYSLKLYVDLGLLEEFDGQHAEGAPAPKTETVEVPKRKPVPLKIVKPALRAVEAAEPAAPRDNLTSKAGDLWREYQGEPNWARLGKAVKGLRNGTAIRDEQILAALERFLRENTKNTNEAKFNTPERFAGQFSVIARALARPTNQPPPMLTPAQRQAEIDAMLAKLDATPLEDIG